MHEGGTADTRGWWWKSLRLALLLALSMSFLSCYLLKQGTALIGFQLQAEPIERITAEGKYKGGEPVPPAVQAFLSHVHRIRAFATNELGLAESRSYTKFVPTDREHLAFVVSAVRELSFERNYWWWPFAGRFPYKGFFDVDDARRLGREMGKRGFDVWVRPVDAFSTLGILRDPLYEFMVNYDEYLIANTIIHEQTHATIFLKNQVQFNEELATFVGDVGTQLYLESVGTSPNVYAQIDDRVSDRATFRDLIFALRDQLQAVYDSSLSDEEKRAEKKRLITEHQADVVSRHDELFRTDTYLAYGELEINNAYIDLFVNYTEDLSLFSDLYDAYDQSIRDMIAELMLLQHPGRIQDPEARNLARRDPKGFIRTVLLDSSQNMDTGAEASVE